MADTQKPDAPATPQPKPAKLPYEPPAVISEEVFETLALGCAKADPSCIPGGGTKT